MINNENQNYCKNESIINHLKKKNNLILFLIMIFYFDKLPHNKTKSKSI